MRKPFNIVIYILAYIGLCVIILLIAEALFFEETKGKENTRLCLYLFNLEHEISSSLWFRKHKALDINKIPMYKRDSFTKFLYVINHTINIPWVVTEQFLHKVLKEFCIIIYKVYVLILEYYSSK